jgi:GNAT superfamily N-acetyltransferase
LILRPAAVEDAPEITRTVWEGFDSYREFAPPGWQPPPEVVERDAPIPRLAHLWMLFVRRQWWGTGLAKDLLRLAIVEASGRDYARMRLYTPAGQARARAFYEREGWSTDGEARFEPMLALDLVEYRRPL